MHYGDLSLLESITSSIPRNFFHDTLVALHGAHKDACALVEKNYSQQVAKDVLPHIRRANFEDEIIRIASTYNFNARLVLNTAKNACHAEIETTVNSKRLVLTALAVPGRFDLSKLKTAQFRKTLAEEAQLHLWEHSRNDGDGFYGMIMYGACIENKDRIDFAYLGFPTADCKKLYGSYNLFALAGNNLNTENVEDHATPKLRENVIRKAT
jgi:hypothetical protein